MRISVAKFTTLPSMSGWVQIHDFAPEGEKLIKRGRLILVIAVSGEGSTPLSYVENGREILARIHEEYFGSLEATPFEALVHAVGRVSQEFSENTQDLEIGALSLVGETAFFASFGEVSGYVLRGGVLSKLLGSAERLFSGSGFTAPGDKFLLGSKNFFAQLTGGEITAALSSFEAQGALDSLAPVVHRSGLERAGAIILEVQKPESIESEAKIIQPEVREENRTISFEKGGVVRKAKYALADVVGRLLSVIPEKRIRVNPDLKDLEGEKSKKTAVTVGVLLLVILALSIVFGVRQQIVKKQKEKYEPRLTSALHDLEEAKTLTILNQSRARELLFAARKTGEDLKNEGIEDKQVEELMAGVAANLGSIAGVYEVGLDNYLDLSLLSSGFVGSELSFSDGRLLVLDRNGKLVSIETETKKSKVVAGPEKLKGALYASPYASFNYVLGEEGVVETTAAKTVIPKDWQEAGGMLVYGGNIYILDKSQSSIWRYAAAGESFGSQKNWFGPGVAPDLNMVKSWVIDGSIWLLSENGRITKYTLGSPREFGVVGVDGNLTGATSIYTDENSKYLYILDQAKGRVVVLDKEGNFQAEYVSEGLKQTTHLVVSEATKKIILLSGSKLLSIEIKHQTN